MLVLLLVLLVLGLLTGLALVLLLVLGLLTGLALVLLLVLLVAWLLRPGWWPWAC